MIDSIRRRLGADRHLVLYLLIGMSSVVIDFVVFSVGRRGFGVHPVIANVISISVAIVWSFSLNTRMNFGVTDRLAKRFLAFLAVSVGGMALSTALIVVFAVWMSVNAELVKVFTLPVVAVLQYSLNRKFSFAQSISSAEVAESIGCEAATSSRRNQQLRSGEMNTGDR